MALCSPLPKGVMKVRGESELYKPTLIFLLKMMFICCCLLSTIGYVNHREIFCAMVLFPSIETTLFLGFVFLGHVRAIWVHERSSDVAKPH